MRNSIRLFSLLLALVMVCSVFNGCGARQTEPEAEETVELEESEDAAVFSSEIDENGYWKGVKASDLVENFSFEGISIPEKVHAVSDESVQALEQTFLSGYLMRTQITDRPVELGDVVNIDYDGKLAGTVADGASTMEVGVDLTMAYAEDGDDMAFLDAFVDALVGKMPGDEVEITVDFPVDYFEEEFRGKQVVFDTRLHYIVQQNELNDALIEENLGESKGWHTVADMEQSIRDQVQASQIQDYLEEYLRTQVPVKSLPESLVQYQKDMVNISFELVADYLGITVDEYLREYESCDNLEAYLEGVLPELEQEATYTLLIQYVAEQLNLEITDADLEAYAAEHLWGSDINLQIAQYGRPYVVQSVMTQRVLDYLREHAVLA